MRWCSVCSPGQAVSDKSSCPWEVPSSWMLGVGRLRQSLVCHVFVTDMVGMGVGWGRWQGKK